MRSSPLLLAASLLCVSCGGGANPGSDGGTGGGSGGDGGSGACNLQGTWKGTLVAGPFSGQQVTWTFAAGGSSTAGFGSNTVNGTWAVSGTTATLTDTTSTPSTIACPAAVAGTYALAWSGNCAQVTFTAQTETCDGRKFAVDGVALARQ